MSTILGIIVIIFAALAGARVSFSRIPVVNSVNIFFLTGTEFLIIGFILGPSVINMLDTEVIQGMYPFIALGLSWLGLIYGIQFDFKRLKRFPAGYLLGSFLQSLVTIAIIFFASYFLLMSFGFHREDLIIHSLILGITGSCSSQTALGLLSHDKNYRKNSTLRMLRFTASVGDFPGLLLFGIAICFLHERPLLQFDALLPFQWITACLILGVVFGFILLFLLSFRLKPEERLLFIIGIVLFSGGLAAYFRVSPLFVNLIAGMTVANFSKDHHLFDDIVAKGEKPIYLILLILAGTLWKLDSMTVVLISAVYLVVRIAGKVAGSFISVKTILKANNFAPLSGFGLINQGGMALAMVVNLQLFQSHDLDTVLLSSVILAVIANELLGLFMAQRVLKRESA